MRSLVIAPQPFFSPRGTPMSVYYRTLVVASMDVKIDLLAYGEGQDVDIPGARIFRIPRFAFLGPVKTGPSALKLFLDVFVAFRTIGLLFRNRYDFVHAHEEAVFIAALLQPFFRYKLVYDMHSSLPEQLNNFGWSRSTLLRRFMTWAEDAVLRRSNAIITICPALADFATSRIDDSTKHFLIENSIFDPVRISDAGSGPDETGIADTVYEKMAGAGFRTVLVYAGTLETYQGIDLLLESMSKVVKQTHDIGLLIVGGSDEQVQHYRAMATRMELDQACEFTGRVPQSAAKKIVARADAVLSPRTRGMNTPLKVYELLDSGKPIVATRIPSHTQVLDDRVSFLAEPNAEEFAEQMLLSVKDQRLAGEKIRNAKALYSGQYSRAVYDNKIKRLLELIR